MSIQFFSVLCCGYFVGVDFLNFCVCGVFGREGETPTVNELLVFFFLVEVEKGKILYRFGVFLLFCGGRFGREGETSTICVLLR